MLLITSFVYSEVLVVVALVAMAAAWFRKATTTVAGTRLSKLRFKGKLLISLRSLCACVIHFNTILCRPPQTNNVKLSNSIKLSLRGNVNVRRWISERLSSQWIQPPNCFAAAFDKHHCTIWKVTKKFKTNVNFSVVFGRNFLLSFFFFFNVTIVSYPKCQTPRIRAKAFFFKPSSEIFGSLYWVIFGNLQKTLGHLRKSLEDADASCWVRFG